METLDSRLVYGNSRLLLRMFPVYSKAELPSSMFPVSAAAWHTIRNR